MIFMRRLKSLALLGCLSGSAMAYASGPSLPPRELRAVVEVTCDFAQAELRYANQWTLQSGHRASVDSLSLKSGGATSPRYQDKLDQLRKQYFAGQERIDEISASCYEDRQIIFNIRTSALRTESGKMSWVAEAPLHLTIGMDRISIARSPAAQD